MPTTFRPSSSILYLHPPKPKHIESIETVLTTLNLTSTQIVVGWKVIVKLKNQTNVANSKDDDTLSRDSRASKKSSRQKRKINAKVVEETNPLSYNIYLRKYGTTNREKYSIVDSNNTLDPPITNNQTYQYSLDNLKKLDAYEFCLQSVNAGEIHESELIEKLFPINAHTELAGRNNPLFLCKEIVMPIDDSESESTEFDTLNQTEQSRRISETRITGRSSNYRILEHEPLPKLPNEEEEENVHGTKNRNSLMNIHLSEEAADDFLLYTAITSGSTTILILIIIAIFCCFRCKRNIHKENHHRTVILDRLQRENLMDPNQFPNLQIQQQQQQRPSQITNPSQSTLRSS